MMTNDILFNASSFESPIGTYPVEVRIPVPLLPSIVNHRSQPVPIISTTIISVTWLTINTCCVYV